MESIWGKQTLFLAAATLAERWQGYSYVLVDIGTGDGRFVQHVAETQPDTLAIGIDACREHLRRVSRNAPRNALYLIANARTLPSELEGLATQITINFPWGSLRDSLLADDAGMMDGLAALARPGARIDVRVNSSALAPAGWSLAEGAVQIRQMLLDAGFAVRAPVAMSMDDLRRLPTTWAKRLAFARDSQAMTLSGSRKTVHLNLGTVPGNASILAGNAARDGGVPGPQPELVPCKNEFARLVEGSLFSSAEA